jgi:hypothetical protein
MPSGIFQNIDSRAVGKNVYSVEFEYIRLKVKSFETSSHSKFNRYLILKPERTPHKKILTSQNRIRQSLWEAPKFVVKQFSENENSTADCGTPKLLK